MARRVDYGNRKAREFEAEIKQTSEGAKQCILAYFFERAKQKGEEKAFLPNINFFVCGYNQTKRIHKLACERASADCSFGKIVSNDFRAKPKDRSRALPKKSMPKYGSPGTNGFSEESVVLRSR